MEVEQEFVDQIEKHQAMIHKICNAYGQRQTRDDLFQEIVLQLWKSYPSFDANRQTKFTTWMYQIAFNTAATSFRRKGRRVRTVADANMEQVIANSPTQDPQNEKLERLYDAIRSLNEIDRAIIMLHLESRTYTEIAEVVGLTESNVGVRINRSKKRLKQRLAGKEYT